MLGDLHSLMQRVQGQLAFPLLVDQDLKSYLEKINTHAEVVVWRQGGVVAGFIAFYCNDPQRDAAFITMLVVDTLCGRQGIGRALMESAIVFARDSGFRVMRLNAHPKNFAAIQFYERCGFSVTDMDGYCVHMEITL